MSSGYLEINLYTLFIANIMLKLAIFDAVRCSLFKQAVLT
jgi:hypothetical protein